MKMAPLLLLSLSIIHGVNAAWYSELCHAGPRYKVRVDPITGKVVPVYPELPSLTSNINNNSNNSNSNNSNSNSNSNNNSNTIDGLSDIFPTEIINDNPVEATFIGAEFDTEPTESGVEDENEKEAKDNTISTTPPFNFRRVLRSNRLWRDFDEDSETEALVMDRNNNLQNNMNNMNNMNTNTNNVPSSMSASFFRRFLGTYYEDEDDADDDAATATTVTATNTRMDQDQNQNQRFLDHASREEEELKAGEFYVRPCLCSESRWTFAEGLGYNDTTNTILTEPAIEIETEAGAEADGSQPKNTVTIPNNIGLADNGQYVTVDTNYPNGDLYLCNVQTVYCGIFDETDTNSIGTIGNSNSNSNTFDIDSYYDQKSLNVKCYDQNVRHIIAKNAWPLILLWYFGLAVICCCTVHGRTAGDYVQDRLTQCGKRLFGGLCGCCCGCFPKYDFDFDFNNRMLNRMVRDDNRERRRLRRSSSSSSDDENETSGDNNESNESGGNNNDNGNGNDNDDNEDTHFWCYSSQRRQFERSLMAQVQWIWRHQEYLREVALREQGLPPPHLKLKVKRFRMETSTSVSREGGFTNSNDLDSTTSVATTATTTTATTSKAGESNSNDKNNNEKGDNDNDNDNDNNEFVTLDFGPNMEDGDGDGDGDEAPPTEHNNENEIDNDDLDSLDSPTCTICFCPFEEGDRIGDLTCKHEFHVDCLKGWVQRKNSCPLCNVRLGKPERQAAAVAAAEALLDETAATTTSNTNNSSNSNININNMNSNMNSNSSSTDSTSRRSLGSRMAYFIWRRETGSVSAADDIAAAARSRNNIESRR